MRKQRAQSKKERVNDTLSVTSQASKSPTSFPKFGNPFKKNDPDPEHRFNKHFSQKYNDSLPLIKQIQFEKEQVNTPFINAQKSLRLIVEQELRNGKPQQDSNFGGSNFKRAQTKSSLSMKTSHHLNTIKDTEGSFHTQSYYDEYDVTLEPFLIDLTRLAELEEKLQWIVDKALNGFQISKRIILQFAFKGEEVGYPSFQGYWEVLFELKLEKLHQYIMEGEYRFCFIVECKFLASQNENNVEFNTNIIRYLMQLSFSVSRQSYMKILYQFKLPFSQKS